MELFYSKDNTPVQVISETQILVDGKWKAAVIYSGDFHEPMNKPLVRLYDDFHITFKTKKYDRVSRK